MIGKKLTFNHGNGDENFNPYAKKKAKNLITGFSCENIPSWENTRDVNSYFYFDIETISMRTNNLELIDMDNFYLDNEL